MKVISKRTFLKGVVNGKREVFEKGKVYDVSQEEYHKYKVYGLRPAPAAPVEKDDKKEDPKK